MPTGTAESVAGYSMLGRVGKVEKVMPIPLKLHGVKCTTALEYLGFQNGGG